MVTLQMSSNEVTLAVRQLFWVSQLVAQRLVVLNKIRKKECEYYRLYFKLCYLLASLVWPHMSCSVVGIPFKPLVESSLEPHVTVHDPNLLRSNIENALHLASTLTLTTTAHSMEMLWSWCRRDETYPHFRTNATSRSKMGFISTTLLFSDDCRQRGISHAGPSLEALLFFPSGAQYE